MSPFLLAYESVVTLAFCAEAWLRSNPEPDLERSCASSGSLRSRLWIAPEPIAGAGSIRIRHRINSAPAIGSKAIQSRLWKDPEPVPLIVIVLLFKLGFAVSNIVLPVRKLAPHCKNLQIISILQASQKYLAHQSKPICINNYYYYCIFCVIL